MRQTLNQIKRKIISCCIVNSRRWQNIKFELQYIKEETIKATWIAILIFSYDISDLIKLLKVMIYQTWSNFRKILSLFICKVKNLKSESHLNFRFHARFEQGVPWHSGNYRVIIECGFTLKRVRDMIKTYSQTESWWPYIHTFKESPWEFDFFTPSSPCLRINHFPSEYAVRICTPPTILAAHTTATDI